VGARKTEGAPGSSGGKNGKPLSDPGTSLAKGGVTAKYKEKDDLPRTGEAAILKWLIMVDNSPYETQGARV